MIDPAKTAWQKLIDRGPYAVVGSMMSSLGMYLATVYLVQAGRSAEAGELRIFTAYAALATIVTLNQSTKFVVRNVVTGDADRLSRLLVDCALVSIAFAALCVAFWWLGVHQGREEWRTIGAIGFIAAASSAFDLSSPVLQAEGRLRALAATNAVRYGSATLILIAALTAGVPVFPSFCAYAGIVAVVGIGASIIVVRPHLTSDWGRVLRGPVSPDLKQAFLLTGANALPFSLEHLDKFIVRALFSDAVLGLYNLGFATGRFVYNHATQIILAFYAELVRHRPSRPMLMLVFWAGTLLGAGCACGLWLCTRIVPGLAFYRPALPTAYMIFAAYGIAGVNSVMLQSAALHVSGRTGPIFVANLLSSLACLLLFGLAALVDGPFALLMLAAHFALRHAVGLVVLSAERWKNANLSASGR